MTTAFTTPTGQTFHPGDRVVRSGALGLHFEDAALGGRITDGLWVTATHEPTDTTTVARLGSSGVHGFVGLATTAQAEAGPIEDWDPGTTPYLIDIVDRRGRFLRMRTIEQAPAKFDPQAPIFLYSAPSRIAPPSFAEVRASIVLEDSSQPAQSPLRWRRGSHAKIEITTAAGTTTGFADATGAVLVLVPVAKAAADQAMHEQTVDLTMQIFFDPALTDPTDPATAANALAGPPTFETLDAQPLRPFLQGSTEVAATTFTATLGTPAVVVTDPSATTSSSSFLLLQPT